MKIQTRHGFAAGVAVLLVVLMTTSSVIVTHQPVKAAGPWRSASDWMRVSGGIAFIPPTWWVKVDVNYRYNGTKVEIGNVNCYGGGLGVDVSITWCGAYRKWVNGRPWMEWGATYKLTFRLAFFDLGTRTRYVRRAVGPGGDTCCSRGG